MNKISEERCPSSSAVNLTRVLESTIRAFSPNRVLKFSFSGRYFCMLSPRWLRSRISYTSFSSLSAVGSIGLSNFSSLLSMSSQVPEDIYFFYCACKKSTRLRKNAIWDKSSMVMHKSLWSRVSRSALVFLSSRRYYRRRVVILCSVVLALWGFIVFYYSVFGLFTRLKAVEKEAALLRK